MNDIPCRERRDLAEHDHPVIAGRRAGRGDHVPISQPLSGREGGIGRPRMASHVIALQASQAGTVIGQRPASGPRSIPDPLGGQVGRRRGLGRQAQSEKGRREKGALAHVAFLHVNPECIRAGLAVSQRSRVSLRVCTLSSVASRHR